MAATQKPDSGTVDPFGRLGALARRGRYVIVILWLVVLGVTVPRFAPDAASVLRGGGLSVDDSDSTRADNLLYGFNASGNHNVVFVFHSGTQTVDDGTYADGVKQAESNLKSVSGVRATRSYFSTQDSSLVSADKHTTLLVVSAGGDLQSISNQLPTLRDAVKTVGIEHYATGAPAAAHDGQTAAQEDLHRAEMVGLPIIVILLLIVFRTVVAALVPLLLGGLAIVLALAALAVLGSRSPTSVFALNVASMIGLGLAIDYSLMIITRYREELAAGHDPEQALMVTMSTAGRSITYSGLTVALAMGALSVMLLPIMLVRSMATSVGIVAVLAVLLGTTLLPALLAIVGSRIEWLRVMPRGRRRVPGEPGGWYRFSQLVMRHPWPPLLASVALLALLAAPIARLHMGGPSDTPGTEAYQADQLTNSNFSPAQLTPLQIVIKTPVQGGVLTPGKLDGLSTLTDRLKADNRVSSVASLPASLPQLTHDQYTGLSSSNLSAQVKPVVARWVNLDGSGDVTYVTVVPKYQQFDSRTQELVHDVRTSTLPGVPAFNKDEVYVGGQPSNYYDFSTALYDRFPAVAGVVVALIFVVLMMFFQSVILPIKAVLMNLASIAASFGMLVVVFQWGVGQRLLGFTSADQVTVITPAILYVVLFALSTDYEVFMLSRVREYFHLTGDNEEAVAAGLQHTAGIITSAALILVGTFGAFTVANSIAVKEIGVGLALGVLIDATVVRIIMVPATMRLLGARNWWMPAWLRRIVPELKEGESFEHAARTAGAPPPPVSILLPSATPAPAPAAAAASAPAGATMRALPALVRAGGPPRGVNEGPRLLTSGSWVGVPIIPLTAAHALRIGRDAANEVLLKSLAVSRVHARIDYQDGHFVLTDMNSTNGVYVNGHRVEARPASHVLHPGDRIVIGGYPTAALTFAAPVTVAAPPPARVPAPT
ncbi:MAG: MMPL family transporter [Chloroflexota bacterium]